MAKTKTPKTKTPKTTKPVTKWFDANGKRIVPHYTEESKTWDYNTRVRVETLYNANGTRNRITVRRAARLKHLHDIMVIVEFWADTGKVQSVAHYGASTRGPQRYEWGRDGKLARAVCNNGCVYTFDPKTGKATIEQFCIGKGAVKRTVTEWTSVSCGFPDIAINPQYYIGALGVI